MYMMKNQLRSRTQDSVVGPFNTDNWPQKSEIFFLYNCTFAVHRWNTKKVLQKTTGQFLEDKQPTTFAITNFVWKQDSSMSNNHQAMIITCNFLGGVRDAILWKVFRPLRNKLQLLFPIFRNFAVFIANSQFWLQFRNLDVQFWVHFLQMDRSAIERPQKLWLAIRNFRSFL